MSFGSLDNVEDALELLDMGTEFPYLLFLVRGPDSCQFFINMPRECIENIKGLLESGEFQEMLLQDLNNILENEDEA